MRLFKTILSLACCCLSLAAWPQEEKKPLQLVLSYHLQNNNLPYLEVLARTKEGKKFIPLPGIEVNLYFNEASEDRLMNKVLTAANGKVRVGISPRFRDAWRSGVSFTFLASSPGNQWYDEAEGEIQITRANIFLDTVEDAELKTLRATVIQQTAEGVRPAAGVELRIAVKRMSGTNLVVGEEDSYTTDSTGSAIAEFKRDSLPGDAEGFITVVAMTEDNETFGNISMEKRIPWGIAPAIERFDRRTLFATRDKSPYWLLVLAYSSALAVLGTIIYLFTRIAVMRRIGMAAESD